MKPDRESNRLPLRAGAMLLLAVAVVFLFLGGWSALKSDEETPAEVLAGAGQSAQASAAATSAPGSAAPTAAPSSDVSAADVPKLCVLNAGTISGLAKEVADELQSAGFTLGTEPGNLTTSSISENTIFYGEGEQDAAAKVADAVPGGADVVERPAAFTRCDGEIVVIVVNRGD